MIADLLDSGLTIAEAERAPDRAPLAGQRFVFTGTLSALTRGEASDRVKALGASVSSAVSRNTGFVVVGESPGTKADKADQLGVPVLDEEAFLDLLSEHE